MFHKGFIKGVSGGCFVLINKQCYPQSAFTHNLPLPTICLYPQSAFTHNPPLPTIRLYPQSAFTHNPGPTKGKTGVGSSR